MERTTLSSILTEVGTYSGYGFAFPAPNVSDKTTIHGLTECLIYHHGTLHSIVSDLRTHFIAISVIVGPQLRSYHVPHQHEASGLIEKWNDFWKTDLQCPLHGSNPRPEAGSTEAVYASNI